MLALRRLPLPVAALAAALLALPAAATAAVPADLADGPSGRGPVTADDAAWLREWADRLVADDRGMVDGLVAVVRGCRSGLPVDDVIADRVRESFADGRAGWASYEDGVETLLSRADATRKGQRLERRAHAYGLTIALAEIGRDVARHRRALQFIADDLGMLLSDRCPGSISGLGFDQLERGLKDRSELVEGFAAELSEPAGRRG